MKIKSVKMFRFVEVETDIGEFRVYEDGMTEFWFECTQEYGRFNDALATTEELRAIQDAAFELMTEQAKEN